MGWNQGGYISACTPTLIQHGEKNIRVQIPDVYELYKGLRGMEVDTESSYIKRNGI